jgi:divalent metal cation (Fe/Co/Zn/Cd) transporter
LGLLSNSLLLEAFALDSAIELFSACVLLWRLRVEGSGKATAATVEQVERRASKLAGYALFVLAFYVVADSAFGLLTHRVSDARQGSWGIVIGLLSAIGMPILARQKLKIASSERLNSKALRADAIEALTCGYLSIVLIIGLAAARLFGWWWLDSSAAMALVPLLIKEGLEAVSGECRCGEECSGTRAASRRDESNC